MSEQPLVGPLNWPASTDQQVAAYRAAEDRDSRRFLNDRDRCQDCGGVEACRCGAEWVGLVLPHER